MRILMLMFLAGLAGCGDVRTDRACGTEAPPPPQVTVLRVEQCWINEEGDEAIAWFGTGFPVSSNGVISYRHDLPSTVTHVYVEGRVASVLDRGSEDPKWDDWIHVRFQSAPDQIPMLDPTVELHPGERVAMVGFPTHGIAEDQAEKWEDVPPSMIYGEIASEPSRLGFPEDVVFIKTADMQQEGLSGGPVMVFRDKEWVVFGVAVGKARHKILKGLSSSRLLVARRIPEHLLER